MTEKDNIDKLEIDGGWPAEPDPRLVEFIAYWRSKFDADGNPPRQGDLNPAEIAHLMPGMVIMERHEEEDRPRYFYRLAGTDHYEGNRRELTGLYLDDIFDEHIVLNACRTYENVLQSGRPHYWKMPNPLPNREISVYERVIMPLRSDDGELTLLTGYWLWR